MKRYITNKTIYVTEYSSLGEFLTDINSLPNNKFYKDRHSSQNKEKEGGKFYGTTDYEQATYMLTHGWDAAAKKLSEKVKMTNATANVIRSSKPSFGVVGTQASVPRYLQGIPTNMVSRQSVYAKQKVVTITKGITYSFRWTTEEILAECIKALQIIQSMENGGQRVKLNVMFSVTKRGYTHMCKVCVKQPDERMSISKMSFALAHPSMLRRFFLKWMEVDPFAERDMGDGYGTPSYDEDIHKAMPEGEYYIPAEIGNIDEVVKRLTSR